MATYKEIFGKQIKFLSSDPANEGEGQIWYNSTSGTFKSVLVSAAWFSQAPTATANDNGASFGSVSSMYKVGGGPGRSTGVEEFTGSGWVSQAVVPTDMSDNAGCGTGTAGLVFGGNNPPGNTISATTFEWDGSSWTAGGAMPADRRQNSGAGSQTAGLSFAGGGPPPTGVGRSANTYEYNGASWTAGGSLPTSLRNGTGTGTVETVALMIGGSDQDAPPETYLNTTYEYDGAAWASGGTLNTGRNAAGASGNSTAALMYGGNEPALSTATESYDGSSWTTSPATLAVATATPFYPNGPGSSAVSAISGAGGQTPGRVTDTQEYSISAIVTTAATWAAGGTKGDATTQQSAGTDGPSSAFATWGGRTVPATTTNLTEEYNGTVWSPGGNLNVSARDRCGGGTLTAAWCGGGTQPAYIDSAEEYNGASWTAVTAIPGAAILLGGTGPQTAGLGVVGQLPPGAYPRTAIEYNGTSWTLGPASSTARTDSSAGMVGNSSNGLIVGGESPITANVEEWSGSAWSEEANLVTGSAQCSDGTFGTVALAYQNGGKTSPSPGAAVAATQYWNGTNWSTAPTMGQARKSHTSGGTATAGLSAAGQTGTTPTVLTSSEEFTPETSAANYKTITTS